MEINNNKLEKYYKNILKANAKYKRKRYNEDDKYRYRYNLKNLIVQLKKRLNVNEEEDPYINLLENNEEVYEYLKELSKQLKNKK